MTTDPRPKYKFWHIETRTMHPVNAIQFVEDAKGPLIMCPHFSKFWFTDGVLLPYASLLDETGTRLAAGDVVEYFPANCTGILTYTNGTFWIKLGAPVRSEELLSGIASHELHKVGDIYANPDLAS